VGFNRARHAIVEAAILATRLQFLPPDEVAREFDRLAVMVEKTGDAPEREAMALLRSHLASVHAGRSHT
jgi:hypothetical protein